MNPRPVPAPAHRPARLPLAALVALALVAGCSSSDDDGEPMTEDTGVDDPVMGQGPDAGPDGDSSEGSDGTTGEAPGEAPDEGPDETPDEGPDQTPDGESGEDPDAQTGPPLAGPDGTAGYAFVSGSTPISRDAGQIERFTLGDEIVSSGTTPATGSDIRVATDGADVYQIGRLRIDSLTRFDPERLDEPLWQYSLNGEETGANPYDIAFLNERRAYVARYGSPVVWIVDPSAETEANFKLGELDLSAYDTDGVPNATDVEIVDGKLFVLLQRLTEFTPDKPGYVAVFDTATDQEIATGAGRDGLPGIALDVTNPEGLQYVEDTDELLVTGRGNIFENEAVAGDPFQGGVVSIDPDAYTADLLVDDGTAEDNDGFVAESLVTSADTGYVLTYRIVSEGDEAFDSETALRRFDPRTGLVAEGVVAGLEERDLAVLALGPRGRLWVGAAEVGGEPDDTSPGFLLIDPATDTIVDEIRTEFSPTGLVFVPASAEADGAGDTGANAGVAAR